jgi:hypothetical protein
MKMISVSWSDCVRESRMDAGFHCMQQALLRDGSLARARDAIFATLDPSIPGDEREIAAREKCIELMQSLPHGVRTRAAKDLMTGSTDHTINIDKAIRSYPFMMIAIAFNYEEVDLVLKLQAEEMLARANSISGLGKAIRRPQP